MLPPRLAAFLLIGLLPCLSGCLIDTSSDRDGVDLQQPKDIPVPQGMKIKDRQHESHTMVNGDYRFANLIYEGTTSPMEVAAFLMARMPKHSYSLVREDETPKGDKVFVFRRGRYTSECTVRKLEFTTQLEVKLRTDQQ